MKFFLAGIMQGSKIEAKLHSQDYRTLIKESLLEFFPDSDVYDPWELNRDSLNYSPETGRKVFLSHNRMCGTEIDVLVAFLPEASMGTAVEMWEAWQNGAFVLSISPMEANWVVKFLSDAIYPDLDSFIDALKTGEVAGALSSRVPRSKRRSLDDLVPKG